VTETAFEADLAAEVGFDPVASAGRTRGDGYSVERRGQDLQRREATPEITDGRVSEAGADIADVGETVRCGYSDEECADGTGTATAAGLQPPKRTSTVRTFLIFGHAGDRSTRLVGRVTRLATTPSRPCSTVAARRSAPPPIQDRGVCQADPLSSMQLAPSTVESRGIPQRRPNERSSTLGHSGTCRILSLLKSCFVLDFLQQGTAAIRARSGTGREEFHNGCPHLG
jgi:hypothetical protein